MFNRDKKPNVPSSQWKTLTERTSQGGGRGEVFIHVRRDEGGVDLRPKYREIATKKIEAIKKKQSLVEYAAVRDRIQQTKDQIKQLVSLAANAKKEYEKLVMKGSDPMDKQHEYESFTSNIVELKASLKVLLEFADSQHATASEEFRTDLSNAKAEMATLISADLKDAWEKALAAVGPHFDNIVALKHAMSQLNGNSIFPTSDTKPPQSVKAELDGLMA